MGFRKRLMGMRPNQEVNFKFHTVTRLKRNKFKLINKTTGIEVTGTANTCCTVLDYFEKKEIL